MGAVDDGSHATLRSRVLCLPLKSVWQPAKYADGMADDDDDALQCSAVQVPMAQERERESNIGGIHPRPIFDRQTGKCQTHVFNRAAQERLFLFLL